MSDTTTGGVEYDDPDDSVCKEFGVREGTVNADGGDVFVWDFECTRCGLGTPCKGDPRGFGGRPYSCAHCGWVSLIDHDAVESFAEEHYVDTDMDRSEEVADAE